jgi:hypothetical protein
VDLSLILVVRKHKQKEEQKSKSIQVYPVDHIAANPLMAENLISLRSSVIRYSRLPTTRGLLMIHPTTFFGHIVVGVPSTAVATTMLLF